jgi:hypothetical protein
MALRATARMVAFVAACASSIGCGSASSSQHGVGDAIGLDGSVCDGGAEGNLVVTVGGPAGDYVCGWSGLTSGTVMFETPEAGSYMFSASCLPMGTYSVGCDNVGSCGFAPPDSPSVSITPGAIAYASLVESCPE